MCSVSVLLKIAVSLESGDTWTRFAHIVDSNPQLSDDSTIVSGALEIKTEIL